MGAVDGDADEQPVREVDVGQFWLSDTTISWDAYALLMGWSPHPQSFPQEEECKVLDKRALFQLAEANKIRLQSCEDRTLSAIDWHAHAPGIILSNGVSASTALAQLRPEDKSEFTYSRKPMVAVSWQEAEERCARLSTKQVCYRLATEAGWEKAARGGLVGKHCAWGDHPPTPELCDFDRFERFAIQPSRALPPNGCGLYGMCGSVWEWTSSPYTLSYAHAAADPGASVVGPIARGGNKRARTRPDLPHRVLRGGSWADGADAVTVSFRMSQASLSWRSGEWSPGLSPNIGFRICRVVVSADWR
jgi:formylglycine-generating enzyme